MLKQWIWMNLAVAAGGCLVDWIIGDPAWIPHPVRLMGNMIGTLESCLRKWMPGRERRAGGCLAFFMCLFWLLVPGGILALISLLGPGFYWAAGSLMCGQLLAAKSLYLESMKVCRPLKTGDVEQARQAVSMIVGRDTKPLDAQGITRAAVETVAENTSDGVIAPMFYMMLLGPAGGYLYKAVNTMDSMVGYKNQKYLEFGHIPARLDDGFNWIPARISGFLMCLAAALLPGYSGRDAWRIFWRDRHNHASPNSAQSESACAGALGLRLAGDAWYFGELYKKPYIGDESRLPCPEDIQKANGLMAGTQVLFLVLLAAAVWIGTYI